VRRRARPLVVLVAAAGVSAAVVALVAGTRGQGDDDAVPAGAPVAVAASLQPQLAVFGDEVRATVAVTVDGGEVDPDSIRIETDFQPFAVLRTRRSRTDAGSATRLQQELTLVCHGEDCLPPGPGEGPRRFRFADAVVSYDTAAGTSSVRVSWRPVDVVSGLSVEQARRPKQSLEADVTPLPAVSRRFSAERLGPALWALAALAGAIGLALVLWTLPKPSIAWRRRGLSPLERALAVVREAVAAGDPAGERKALERLGRELGTAGRPELASTAHTLAWSAQEPTPESVGDLTGAVERALPGRRRAG
jgi:hypothetical protein